MILNLLASILLACNVGMNLATNNASNFKPTKKYASNINNYSITLSGTNRQTTTYENGILMPNGARTNDIEYKDQLTYSSSYLNIVGNIYQTLNQTTLNNQWGTYTQSLAGIENNYDNVDERASKFCYALQITPYNINIETTATCTIELVYPDYRDNQGSGINIHRIAYLRNVYTSLDSNWANYINKQLARTTTNTIVDDIKDINNGFYYTQDQKFHTVNYDASNVVLTEQDTFDLNITPNQTNYYVIEYIPVLDAVYYDYGTDTELDRITTPMIFSPGNTGPSTIKIMGTNVIPTGTYEVVDIPGLMFEVIGMPFAFVSQAFNLTLFPGTPYQVNIANLFLSIIAIFVFVWLITLFIKTKGS